LTNASGTVVAAYRADEWGLPAASAGTSAQPFGFAGEPRDGTGLTYLRARYYDPDLARFISRDTWPGLPVAAQTQNRYSYAINNPTTNADPSGHIVDILVDVGFIFWDLGSLVFGPEKDRGTNLLALGADVGSAAIPFVAGGGLVVRAAAHVDDLTTKLFNIGRHIDTKTLDAARRELAGEVIKLRPDGSPFDHVQEIKDAQNGLLNLIEQVQKQLGNSPADADRQELEFIYSQASQMLDWTEAYVPR
jgi:RHS repeat-associated protein